ncbi:MAG: hypothetical protein LBD16_00825 [Oscillospiraceae bacterium]|nr:hypothetical protein [Oscillospiraceae bacterium]
MQTNYGYGDSYYSGVDCADDDVGRYAVVLDPRDGQPPQIILSTADDKIDLSAVPTPVCDSARDSANQILGWYDVNGKRYEGVITPTKNLLLFWGYGAPSGGGTLPTRMQTALGKVLTSIGSGDRAGGGIMLSIANALNKFTVDGTVYNSRLPELLETYQRLINTLSSMECITSQKMCVSLKALCYCGGDDSGCCVLEPDVADTLSDVIEGIAQKEDGAGQVVQAGADALRLAANEGGLTDADVLDVMDAVYCLTESAANLEDSMSKKLCRSVNALCSCATDAAPCSLPEEALASIVESISVIEEAASGIVVSGASALEHAVSGASPDADDIMTMTNAVNKLASSAKHIEQASAKKLNCVLTAQCDKGASPPCQCEDCDADADCSAVSAGCTGVTQP